MRYLHVLIAFLILAATATMAIAQIKNSKLSGQSFRGEIVINAAPAAVWATLTDVQKLSAAMGYEYKGAAKKMEKLGDHVSLKVFGDTGNFIVVHLKPGSELRYTWEPDNGTYLCQERWQLLPAGKGTKLVFEDRYTESGPQSAEDLAAQVKAYNEGLQKLKAACEGK